MFQRQLPTFVLIALLALSISPQTHAKDDSITHGPKIGSVMTSALDGAIDQNDKTQTLNSLRGKNGLILLFSRSLSW